MNRTQYRTYTISKYQLIKDVPVPSPSSPEIHADHRRLRLQRHLHAVHRQLQQRHPHLPERRLRHHLRVSPLSPLHRSCEGPRNAALAPPVPDIPAASMLQLRSGPYTLPVNPPPLPPLTPLPPAQLAAAARAAADTPLHTTRLFETERSARDETRRAAAVATPSMRPEQLATPPRRSPERGELVTPPLQRPPA